MKHAPDTLRDFERVVSLCERHGTHYSTHHGCIRSLDYTAADGIRYRLVSECNFEYPDGRPYATCGVPTLHGTWFAFGATEAHVINWSPAISGLLDDIEAAYLNDGAELARRAEDLIPAEVQA